MEKRSDGTWAHHRLLANDARIVCNRNFSHQIYDIYRPDGLYCKQVMSFNSEESAIAYCVAQGWRVQK